MAQVGSMILLDEYFVKQRLAEDSEKGIEYQILWERVLEHIQHGQFITYDLITEELHWITDNASVDY